MNTTQAQQKALDDALVAPVDRPEFGKCNMRLKTYIKPKEATFQVVLDALALTPFYRAFLITLDIPAIYMQEFWAIVSVHKSSIIFIINKKKISLDVDIDLGHTGDITYLTNVNIDYLHQPWSAFATFINKCLSGKETIMDKISDFDTSPKQKLVQATKGTKIKSKAKVSKSNKKKQPAKKLKAKGLAVLSEVALIEAEQLKLATKRRKKDFHISHASGLGDGVDTQSKVLDEQQQKTSDSDEDDDDEDDFDNDSDDNDDERTESKRDEIPNPNKTNEEHNKEEEEYDDEFNIKEEEKIDYEESMNKEEDDEVTNELYDDVNVNLGNEDTDMTNADQGASEQQNASKELGFDQVEEDAHVTLTPILDTQKTKDTTTSLLALPDFASVFKFNERVTNLEKDLLEIKRVDQYAQALSSIPVIVDRYMDNKLGEAINKTILAHNLDCRQEA
ncbi:hypothetical protein Tco_0540540 [Tanacetum coccineum]